MAAPFVNASHISSMINPQYLFVCVCACLCFRKHGNSSKTNGRAPSDAKPNSLDNFWMSIANAMRIHKIVYSEIVAEIDDLNNKVSVGVRNNGDQLGTSHSTAKSYVRVGLMDLWPSNVCLVVNLYRRPKLHALIHGETSTFSIWKYVNIR